ncbi:fluoride efflux transporter CrcB [Iodidimonas sp. SYSU 1G8]|uniref:fluoride efflux transporter CrcB n=1 Tax=Iodidimonas sp. SYSU 1G8 TaxID=3133967 RepID=UPI0031FE6EA1
MSSYYTYMAVAAGGAAGSLARFMLAGQVMRWTGPGFPWGTLTVNVLGGLIMGILIELFAVKFSPSPALQAGLTVGLLGGFTTFSSFSLETVLMIQRNEVFPALAYVAGSVVLCVAAVFFGMFLVRSIL